MRGWGLAIVSGRSMEPTLHERDRLLVRWGASPSVGDVVVIRLRDGQPLIVKRIVHRDPDGWWVERDNPDEGLDSWSFGAIPDANVLGVIRWRLRPLRKFGRIPPPPVPLG